MNVGRVFAALPIAFFWMLFIWFAVVSLTNPVTYQNNLTSWLLVSFIPLLFLLILTGTILLIRHIKNELGSGLITWI
jgi:hypothetical protein